MVLVDSSVWIDHLWIGNKGLGKLLNQCQVVIHPMVIGELACGNLQNRTRILSLLNSLPRVVEATHDEALHCLEQNRLMGKGIGLVDLHLLASTLISSNTFVWTRDKRLQQTAHDLKIGWKVAH